MVRRAVHVQAFQRSLETSGLRHRLRLAFLIPLCLGGVSNPQVWARELRHRPLDRPTEGMQAAHDGERVVLVVEVIRGKERVLLHPQVSARLQEVADVLAFTERHACAVDLRDQAWPDAVHELAQDLARAESAKKVLCHVLARDFLDPACCLILCRLVVFGHGLGFQLHVKAVLGQALAAATAGPHGGALDVGGPWGGLRPRAAHLLRHRQVAAATVDGKKPLHSRRRRHQRLTAPVRTVGDAARQPRGIQANGVLLACGLQVRLSRCQDTCSGCG
mmetsp:Transcript_75127/g.207217  ORF Transcript_75127/g.207217 Transcript_75127/m.207217 type:complete len:276 (-) Transcript_75127:1024-1851(-)